MLLLLCLWGCCFDGEATKIDKILSMLCLRHDEMKTKKLFGWEVFSFPPKLNTHTHLQLEPQPASFMSRLSLWFLVTNYVLMIYLCSEDHMFHECIGEENHCFEPNRSVGKIKTHCMVVFLSGSSILLCSLLRNGDQMALARRVGWMWGLKPVWFSFLVREEHVIFELDGFVCWLLYLLRVLRLLLHQLFHPLHYKLTLLILILFSWHLHK